MSRKGRKEKKEKKNAERAAKKSATAPSKARKKTTDKWKKKAWYTIIAPKEFESKEIGETITERPETLKGRVITITGRDLANQPKKQHIQIKFKVTEVSGQKAMTEVMGHVIKDNYMKRVVRRRSSKVMTVKNYRTHDDKNYKIKVIIITEKKVSKNQKTAVRKKTEELIKKIISGLEARKVVDELVFGTIPNKVYPQLKKIVPIKRIEITNSSLIVAK